MTDTDFLRYLAAKRTVDDRALNRVVWSALEREIAASPHPPAILDLGCGICTMLERLVEWRPATRGRYTGVDASAVCMEHARQTLPRRLGDRGLAADAATQGLRVTGSGLDILVDLVEADLYDLPTRAPGRRWDLVVAHAFIDLVEVPRALPVLFALAAPRGLLLLTIAFDGVTALEPAVDRDLDGRIESAYHRTMDARVVGGRPSGDSRTGRHLIGHLAHAGASVIEAGASDWVVFARDGEYPGDEAFFLRAIVDTMAGALTGAAGIGDAELERWRRARHTQIDRGELVYIAHQLDVLARTP